MTTAIALMMQHVHENKEFDVEDIINKSIDEGIRCIESQPDAENYPEEVAEVRVVLEQSLYHASFILMRHIVSLIIVSGLYS